MQPKRKRWRQWGWIVPREKKEFPEGVQKTSSGKFAVQIGWSGKYRYIGTFDTPAQASAAYKIVKKVLANAKVSSCGAEEANVMFDEAKKKALETVEAVI